MNATQSIPVVLIHGLWMRTWWLGVLAWRLRRRGLVVHLWRYQSWRAHLDDSAAQLAAYCQELGVPAVHIVGHSLGGLVAVTMLAKHPSIQCPRLVMIGSPYGGSCSAQALMQWPGGGWCLGRSIREWLSQTPPLLRSQTQLGVISGVWGVGLGRLLAPNLSQPHDGVVSLEETRVVGAQDTFQHASSHMSLIFSAPVAQQCANFLEHGVFAPAVT